MFGVEDIDFEKCGDVIVAPKQKVFALTCSLCHDVFMHFAEFRVHILKDHDVYLGLLDSESSHADDEEQEIDANDIEGNEIDEKEKEEEAKNVAINDGMELGEDVETQDANTFTDAKNNENKTTKKQENETMNAAKDPTTTLLEPIETESKETNLALNEEKQKPTETDEVKFIEENGTQSKNSSEKQSEMQQGINSTETIQAMDVDEIEEENLQKSESSSTCDKTSEVENLKMNNHDEDKDNITESTSQKIIDEGICNNTPENINRDNEPNVAQTIEDKETTKEDDEIIEISSDNDEKLETNEEGAIVDAKLVENKDQKNGNDIENIDKKDKQLMKDIDKESKLEKYDNRCQLNDNEMPQNEDVVTKMNSEVDSKLDREIKRTDEIQKLASSDGKKDLSYLKEKLSNEEESNKSPKRASENSVENNEISSDMDIDEELTLKLTNGSEGTSKDSISKELLEEQNLRKEHEENVEPSRASDHRPDQRLEQNIEKRVDSSETGDILMDNNESPKAPENENLTKENEMQNSDNMDTYHKDDNIKKPLETEKESNRFERESIENENSEVLMDDVKSLEKSENSNHVKKNKMEDQQDENESNGKKAKLEDEIDSQLTSEKEQSNLIETEKTEKSLNQSSQESNENDLERSYKINKIEIPKVSERRKSLKIAEIFEELDLELDDEDEDMRVFESLMLREGSEDESDDEEKDLKDKEKKKIQPSSEVITDNTVNVKPTSETISQSIDQPKESNVISTNDTTTKIASDPSICDKYDDDLPIAIEDDGKVETEIQEKTIFKENEVDVNDENEKENDMKNAFPSKSMKNKTPLGIAMNNAIAIPPTDKNNEAIEKIKSDLKISMSPKLKSSVQSLMQTPKSSPARTRSAINQIYTPKNQNKLPNVDTPRPTVPINRMIFNNNKRRLSVESSGNALNSTRSSPSYEMENIRKIPKLDESNKINTNDPSTSNIINNQKTIRKLMNKNIYPAIEVKAVVKNIENKTVIEDGTDKKSFHKNTENMKKPISENQNHKQNENDNANSNEKEKEKEKEMEKEKEKENSIKETFNLSKNLSIRRVSIAEDNRPSSSKTPSKASDRVTIQKIQQLPNLNLSVTLDKINPQCLQKLEKSMDTRRVYPVVRIKRLNLQKTEADL